MVTFSTDKFGGFIAETFRVMTMMSPWIFSCLDEEALQAVRPTPPPEGKNVKDWTKGEAVTWLDMRGLKFLNTLTKKNCWLRLTPSLKNRYLNSLHCNLISVIVSLVETFASYLRTFFLYLQHYLTVRRIWWLVLIVWRALP